MPAPSGFQYAQATHYLLGTPTGPPDYNGSGIELGGVKVVVGNSYGKELEDAIWGLNAYTGLGALNPDGTHRGNTYVCAAGSHYFSNDANPALRIPVSHGDGWTRITTADLSLPARGSVVDGPGNASKMFKISSSAYYPNSVYWENRAIAFDALGYLLEGFNTGYTTSVGWIFTGMEVTSLQAENTKQRALVWIFGDSEWTTPDQITHKGSFLETYKRLIFDRCYMHPNGRQQLSRSIFVADAQDFQCWDSWLEAQDVYGGEQISDANAIFPRRGRYIHLEHNEFVASAECCIIGDQGGGASTYDFTVKRNHMWKKSSWFETLPDGQTLNPVYVPPLNGHAWGIKNIFEVKAAVRGLVVGNHLEHNICNLYQQSDDGPMYPQSDQGGGAVVTNAGGENCPISDIEYRSNLVEDSPGGVDFSSGYAQTDDLRPFRCWFHNNLFRKIGGRFFFWNGISFDSTVEHNTSVPGNNDGSPNSYWWETSGRYAVWFNTYGGGSGYRFFNNAFGAFENGVNGDNGPGISLGGNAYWGPAASTRAGLQAFANALAAGINLETGALDPASPLKGTGTISTDGKDVGVDFDLLANDMGGIETGGPPTADFVAQQVNGTRTVWFTDSSSGSPTSWDWDYGDGSPHGTTQSPSHLYAGPGPYSVTLVAGNQYGTDPITKTVTVVDNFGFDGCQQANFSSGTSTSLQIGEIKLGQLVIVELNRADQAATTCEDTLGNVYTPVDPTNRPRWFYSVATHAGVLPTVTVHYGTAITFCRMIVRRYIASGGISYVNQNSGAGSAGSPMNSGDVVTTAAMSLLIGNDDFSTTSPTPPSGWSFRDSQARFVADRLNVAPGTYSYQPTYTGTQAWSASIASFALGATTNVYYPTAVINMYSGVSNLSIITSQNLRRAKGFRASSRRSPA